MDVPSGTITFSDYSEYGFPDEYDLYITLSDSDCIIKFNSGDMAAGDFSIGKDGSSYTFKVGLMGDNYGDDEDWAGYYIVTP